MKKNLFYILNILLVFGIVMSDVCYACIGGLWLKSVTSSLFVLLAIVNVIHAFVADVAHKRYSIIMLVGFAFAMMGDVVLNIHFMIGAILFAIGHIFYFVAYCLLEKLKWLDLILSAIILVPSVLVITLVPIFDFGGVLMEIICVIYAIIISFMLGKAISNAIRTKKLMTFMLAIGSFFFFFSDLMLLFNVFANVSIVFDILCLATYFPAQAVLASSMIFLPVKGESADEQTKPEIL